MGYIPDLFKESRNELSLASVLGAFVEQIDRGDVVGGPDGDVTAELLGTILKFNPNQREMVFGTVKKTNTEYVKKELEWYLSECLNINPLMADVKVWKKVANAQGHINSNYGWAIHSSENGNQYGNCLQRLLDNPHTKRGVMIYTRPSMWEDCKREGINDFMCTDGVQCQIVRNRLIYIVKQRSCELIYGLFNDLAWHQYVYGQLLGDLRAKHKYTQSGIILYYPFNLHVHEKHFDLVKKMYNIIGGGEPCA